MKVMRCISIWQPFASLIVKGCKVFETRSWAAPASIIGHNIGIASTKVITSGQRAHCADEDFKEFYESLCLPSFDKLPLGYLLGTVRVDSVELMTEEFMEEVSNEEKAYGWWSEGYYAWRLTDPVEFAHPIPIRGAQGLYEWKGDLNGQETNTGKT